MVRPSDTIEIEVELKERLANAFFLVAKVSVDGKLAVRFEFACTLVTAPRGAPRGSVPG
jgi:3-hydroxyacyl-[acyl-carrier-protein] dehydratase